MPRLHRTNHHPQLIAHFISNARGKSNTIQQVKASVPQYLADPRKGQSTHDSDVPHYCQTSIKKRTFSFPAVNFKHVQSNQTHLHAIAPAPLCHLVRNASRLLSSYRHPTIRHSVFLQHIVFSFRLQLSPQLSPSFLACSLRQPGHPAVR